MSKAAAATTRNDRNNGGILLSLPQSDLPNAATKINNSNVSSNKVFGATARSVKKPNLVLFQLPRGDAEFQRQLWDGNCHIYSNRSSSTFVSTQATYKLITVGTSNTLVVWEKEQNDGQENRNDDGVDEEVVEPSAKKIKQCTKTKVTPCRLIQPGGNGASFLVGESYQVPSQDIYQWFSNQKKGIIVSASTLRNVFQSSSEQIDLALSEISNVIPILFHNGDEQNDDHSPYWQLVTDDEVLFGQRALVELLSEEDIVVDDSQTNTSTCNTCYDVARKVSQRLLPLLFDQDQEGVDEDDRSTTTATTTKEQRSLGIAQKTVWMAQKQIKKQKRYIPFTVDPEKVKNEPTLFCAQTFCLACLLLMLFLFS
jgi:hypothetical protein